jgi:hypothetical protein
MKGVDPYQRFLEHLAMEDAPTIERAPPPTASAPLIGSVAGNVIIIGTVTPEILSAIFGKTEPLSRS